MESSERIPAGGLADWLCTMESALVGDGDADVPCGACTACCRSSQFVQIGPEETDALDHIPEQLLFPAPLMPAGHVVLGYDEQGRCPMLTDAGCSIYEHRPRTCRTYDCRVFAATGVAPDDDKPLIAAQAQRWQFEQAADDATLRAALSAAAAYVSGHLDERPVDLQPRNRTQQAVLAVQLHPAFVDGDPDEAELRVRVEEIRQQRSGRRA